MHPVPLIPRTLPGGFIVDLSRGHPEVGGFDCVIWRNATRTEGFWFNRASLREVREILSEIERGRT